MPGMTAEFTVTHQHRVGWLCVCFVCVRVCFSVLLGTRVCVWVCVCVCVCVGVSLCVVLCEKKCLCVCVCLFVCFSVCNVCNVCNCASGMFLCIFPHLNVCCGSFLWTFVRTHTCLCVTVNMIANTIF